MERSKVGDRSEGLRRYREAHCFVWRDGWRPEGVKTVWHASLMRSVAGAMSAERSSGTSGSTINPESRTGVASTVPRRRATKRSHDLV